MIFSTTNFLTNISMNLISIVSLIMAAQASLMGGLSGSKKVLLGEEEQHPELFKVLEHEDVRNQLSDVSSSELRPVEYRTQVVQGMKYVVLLQNTEGDKFEVHIWQKPYNSVKDSMPAPQLISVNKVGSEEESHTDLL